MKNKTYNTAAAQNNKRKNFICGAHDGLPIAFGYLPVSFSFGLLASAGGLPVWASLIISMTSLTSAGQFAGLGVITAAGSFAELAVGQFIINIRYMLMSLALSQKLEKMNVFKRIAVAFGITDEIFAVAATKPGEVGYFYMAGLIAAPYIGWSLGTLLGATVSSLLPAALSSAMGVTLYAMFIAIFLPEMKKNRSVVITVILAAGLSTAFTYLLPSLSSGWSMIIAAAASAAITAALPCSKEEAV